MCYVYAWLLASLPLALGGAGQFHEPPADILRDGASLVWENAPTAESPPPSVGAQAWTAGAVAATPLEPLGAPRAPAQGDLPSPPLLATVVLLTCNRPQYVLLALRQIALQDYPALEALVVHDGTAPLAPLLRAAYPALDVLPPLPLRRPPPSRRPPSCPLPWAPPATPPPPPRGWRCAC